MALSPDSNLATCGAGLFDNDGDGCRGAARRGIAACQGNGQASARRLPPAVHPVGRLPPADHPVGRLPPAQGGRNPSATASLFSSRTADDWPLRPFDRNEQK